MYTNFFVAFAQNSKNIKIVVFPEYCLAKFDKRRFIKQMLYEIHKVWKAVF